MLKAGYILVAFVLCSGMSHMTYAEAWSLSPCTVDGKGAHSRATYAAEVRGAQPDTPLFVVHPFPKTDAEVFENFVEFHVRVFADTSPDSLPLPERNLLEALHSGRIEYEVHEVENWTPLRCGVRKAREHWFLLRLFDARNGKELARVSIDGVGHVGKLRHAPADGEEFDGMLSFSESRSLLRRVIPNRGHAQYIATHGTLRCDELNPCVAMRDRGKVYVHHPRSDLLYGLEISAKRLSLKHDLSLEVRRQGALERILDPGDVLISLGRDDFAVGKPLTIPVEKR